MKLALAGDTMLGRGVAACLAERRPQELVSPELVEVAHAADVFVLNLECCSSERGQPWPDPWKPFFFRAPPAAVETLAHLGVDCVTLANNHALDFGAEAARAPVVLECADFRLRVVAVADRPREYAADGQPGIAFADLWRASPPEWLLESVRAPGADAVLVTPHWGPNMAPEPAPHVRRAAVALVEAGATLVAGHSAHVFQGVAGRVLYDLGDFLDDYAVDPLLRNDLGLLFLVDLDESGPRRLEAIPLKLDYRHTRLAEGEDAEWIRQRFRRACAALGTEVSEEAGRLVIAWPS